MTSAKNLLAPPSGVSASSLSLSSIQILWSASNGATSYEVHHDTAENGAFGKLAEVTALTYTHMGLANNTTHYYKVYSKNGAETSTAAVFVASPTSSITAPQSLSLSVISTIQINLSWTFVLYAERYYISRSTSGGDYVEIANVTWT